MCDNFREGDSVLPGFVTCLRGGDSPGVAMGVACPTCAACHPAVPPTPVRLRLWQGHCLVLVVSHLSQGHRWSRLPPVCSVAGLKPLCLSCTKGLHTLFDCHRRPIAACCIFPSLHGHWHTCSSKRKTYTRPFWSPCPGHLEKNPQILEPPRVTLSLPTCPEASEMHLYCINATGKHQLGSKETEKCVPLGSPPCPQSPAHVPRLHPD